MQAERPLSVIRLDQSQKVDDVAISGDLLRLERMEDGVWWLCIYRGQQRTAFSLSSASPIEAEVVEDSIGCHDDTVQ